MPDFTQIQDHWKDSGGRWTFCGPTAAANSLFWMSYQYDLPKLRQRLNGTPYVDDFEMIRLLAEDYMGFVDRGTYYDPLGGVRDANFISGKESYLHARYPWLVQKSRNADFSRDINDKVTGIVGTPPTLEWIKTELHNCEDVEIKITYLEQKGQDYYYHGGHWLTLVGWDLTQLGVHDPDSDNDLDPCRKDYPGTAFDHWAYDDYYAHGTINIAGTDFVTLGYSAGLICVMDMAVSESIPEPATMSLLGMGMLVVLRRRRKH